MKCQLIVIGCSLGGFSAMRTILGAIPKNYSIPIILVQHRDRGTDYNMDNVFRNLLRRHTPLIVEEADDRMPIEPQHLYLAPGDYHLIIEKSSISLSVEEPVSHARPSIDVTFDTASRSYGSTVTGVLLTGSSSDGADGAAAIEKRGGTVIIQSPDEAEYNTLPIAAIAKTQRALQMPLIEIGQYLRSLDHSQGGAPSAFRTAG